ncbi:MAG: thioredoxin domain-containing protein, partial [Deltaproteobacteria bacterium]|nr:thioredoxin domain-containing protein [Deltaproteobacteria bacterium]
MDTSRKANALLHERSPYLLQHAHNPVAWEPWGDAAFARALAEDKPVFLSVGYSACHWCHVMERESFEDEATAALLNERFVSIKVDREERPDVDQVYQLAHQVLTQRGGGWPLSMFLTPDRRPFYGGTYFPDQRRHGSLSFREVLTAIVDAWTDRRDEVVTQAGELTATLARVTRPADPDAAGSVAPDALERALLRVLPRVDPRHGGFGGAPKFPNTMTHDLLLVGAALDVGGVGARCADATLHTLQRMRAGGIWDHLGGGFARYSTDAEWKIPHFEKMLYDNAQLLRLAVDAAGLVRLRGGDDSLRETLLSVARDTRAYLLREMRSPEGFFYSAQDADSEGEEGRFFVWTAAQVEGLVGPADAEAFCALYDVSAEGNFEHGRSVLWTPRPLEQVAAALGRPVDELVAVAERVRPVLLAAREQRPRPMRDDKCLASWNGLALGALAHLGAALDEPDAVALARDGLYAWRDRAFRDGVLAHAIKDGDAYGTAFLDDHGALANAAVDVFEATADPAALAFARALLDAVLARFVDPATGALYFSPADAEVVLYRSRDAFDHAYPGGVGLTLEALLRVATLTGDRGYRAAADRAIALYAAEATGNPLGMGSVLRAVDRATRGPVEVIVLGDPARDDTRALVATARSVFLPHRALLVAADAASAVALGLDGELAQGRGPTGDGAPRAYVCRGTTCQAPVGDGDTL